MQFREQGKRIQVLAYRGYDREKKRAQVKLLGSFDRYLLNPSDELTSVLTDNEKTELQSHINYIRQSKDDGVRQSNVLNLASHITKASDSLVDTKCLLLTSQEYADEVYAAMDRLTRRLRAMGFKRPTRGKDATKNVDVLPSIEN